MRKEEPAAVEKTPGTDTEDRDKAVALLQDIFARAMRQGSPDQLDPDFRAEIASVVDSIIAAAKPGNPHTEGTTAASSPSSPEPESLGELARDIVGDVEAIPGAIQRATKRKPH